MGSQIRQWPVLTGGLCLIALLASWHLAFGKKPSADAKLDPSLNEHATEMLAEGMQTFRFDTFGSEEFASFCSRDGRVGISFIATELVSQTDRC